MKALSISLLLLLATGAAAQQPADTSLPGALREVGFRQNLGDTIPVDARFTRDDGQETVLADLVAERPTILALVYYECPMICNMVLDGLFKSLQVVDFTPGEDYQVVVLSFDPTEGPKLAAAKKENYLEAYGFEEHGAFVHFLTGQPEEVERVAQAVGFDYAWDEATQQYAHATGITVLTPDARIARYLFGIEYAPKDLRLALVESADGEIGNVVDQLLLFCFQYDPSVGKYGASVIKLMRLGAILTVLGIAGFMFWSRRRDRSASAIQSTGVA